MSTVLWLICWLVGLASLAFFHVSRMVATIAIGAGLVITTFFSHLSWLSLIILWGVYSAIAFCLNHPDYRKRYLLNPAFNWMKSALPSISETEKAALEAGTVGWEAELFSGSPQWEKLLTISAPKLNEEEQAFLDGPVVQLCEMINEWEITHRDFDLSQEAWKFLKNEGFFALIIPKKYGGKGFSAFAHSEILTTLAGRSLTLASTVAVPNSLGPSELLLHYGTQEQRDYYLPRLAKGEEIPCFALTGPQAGSDAGSIPDTGVICRGVFEGNEIIGIKLNWDKRYITLAPIATLLGLAFKLYDPDSLIGDKKELGITCALIPTNRPGITIGRRHLPAAVPFQNGPTQGKDVFIPVDWIIGGPAMAGQGWRMLVECLSAGRAISLPSTSAGSARIAALAGGAYCRLRRQFKTALCSFEGIQEVLGRIGGFTYMCEAVRHLTSSIIDAGEKPSIPGAISKYHVTEFGRKIASDMMDIHGGKGIMLGPLNFLAGYYQGAPIAITVEGANILTRNMIIFGQGAARCHPFILKEIEAVQYDNQKDFEHYLGQHLSYSLGNAAQTLFHGLTFSKFAKSPNLSTKTYFQQIARCSSAFALIADVVMAIYGGKLKLKESLSARLADMLSMMYIMSAVLKHYQDQGSHESDLPLVKWSLDYCAEKYWQTLDKLLHNLPQRALRVVLRMIVMPLGLPRHAPKDILNKEITEILVNTNAPRTRLGGNTFISADKSDPFAMLNQAFEEAIRLSALMKRLFDAVKTNDLAQAPLKQVISHALRAKMITPHEATDLNHLDALLAAVIAVNDFSSDELSSKATDQSVFKKKQAGEGFELDHSIN